MKMKTLLATALISGLSIGCAEDTTPPTSTLEVSEADFVKSEGTKADSSVEAIFVDMAFSGTLISDSSSNLNKQIQNQLLFTIGHLNQQDSIGRLDKMILSNVTSADENGRVRINYDVVLPVAWGRRDSIPTTYEFKIPVDMSSAAKDAFTENYKVGCVDHTAHDVDTASMWYYYRATVPTCGLIDDDIYTATANVTISEINTTGKYPEYDKIYEDDVFNVVAIFGKYEDGATTVSDAGIAAYNRFVGKMHQQLRGMNPTIEPSTTRPGVENPEVNFTVSLGDGKTMNVTTLLVDNVRTAGPEFNDRYEELSSSADLISYSGHAGLGANIRALANKGSWVEGQYAVVFMNGCDTYAYVDSALNDAHARINLDDPNGTKYVDIITNAMPAFFREVDRSTLALITGLMDHRSPKTFESMFRGIDDSQVVLVSGEEDNTFVPGGSTGEGEGDWEGMTENDSVTRGSSNSYETPVLAAGVYEVAMTGTGDADLYVKIGQQPSRTDYDCRPYKNGSKETCRVELSGPAIIHVTILGYADATYEIVASKVETGTNSSATTIVTKTSTPDLSIPDNDLDGVVDSITVEEDGMISNATIDLNIEHTYRGDITVMLLSGSKLVEVYKGSGSQANVNLDGKVLADLKGETLQSEYQLKVVDSASRDIGKLVSWGLTFELE